MPALSVIIPAYNTKIEYLSTCLDSIANSSLKDMEVIVVDDGSTVDYKELKEKYSNFTFYKIENQGTLKARLFGLSKASGDYIYFIDSDDAISFDYLEAMLLTAKQTGSDIVFNDWAFWTLRTKYVCANDSTINTDFCLSGEDVLYKYFSKYGTEHSYYVIWNKIFKREILLFVKEKIEELNLPKTVFAEDVLISFFAFTKANRISNTHLGYYFYRIHNDQQIYVSNESKLLNQILSMSKVFSYMETYLKKISRFDKISELLFKWKKIMASSNYEVAKNSKYSNLIDTIKKAYGVEKLTKLPMVAQRPYAKHQLLPLNVDDIEDKLKEIFLSTGKTKIYAKKHSFALNQLTKIKHLFDKEFELVTDKKQANIIMPKEIYPLKLKILHNYFVYSLGIFLFPKGSKIRKFLKSRF